MMSNEWRALGLAIALTGCCMGGSSAPAPAIAPAVPLAAGAAYTVAPGVPVWSDAYAAGYLSDGTNTSYWCTSMGPTFPIVATLNLNAPSAITGVDFDTRVPSYETSAINLITVETLGAGGAPLDAQTVQLSQNAINSLTFAAPLVASSVRLTFHSNFGGAYAALAEVTLRTGAASGVPVTPTAAPPAPAASIAYTAAPTLPVWNDGYSAARMQDNQPTTYWCTPMGTAFPFTGTFTLATPSIVSGVSFDNRLPGYDTSGIQGVTINAYGPAGDLVTTTTSMLPQSSATLVPLPIPVMAARIDVVFLSNFGGQYAGLAEMQIR